MLSKLYRSVVEHALQFPEEPLPNLNMLKEDFARCVERAKMSLSTWRNFWQQVRRQMSQFCGQYSVCIAFYSQRSMMAAMRNVERHYTVVGVTEMWDDTLKVLEYKLPAMFTGLFRLYAEKYKKKVVLTGALFI